MAKTIGDEELQLRKRARHRLIGAIALVFLVVVSLPMLLDSEPKPATHDVTIQIPAQNAGTFVSKIVPLSPETAEPKPAAKAEPAPPAKSEKPPVAVAPEPAAAKEPAPKVTATPKAQTVPSAAPSKSGQPKTEARSEKTGPKAKDKTEAKAAGPVYVIQVVALADANKARELQEKLVAAGVKAYTEPVATAGGTVTRVRAGPFSSRAAAEQSQQKLKGMGLNGNVTTK